MPLAQHDEMVALGREPIRPDSPAGDPCRYEESFERLQAQLDRLGSLTGEEVDWRLVVQLAADLLKNKSKDLLVMTYLTLALFECHAYAGLAAGLTAYGEFMRNFWEACYPKVKPPHGRYNAVQYLADRLLPLVELKDGQCRKPPTAADKEAVHQCAEQVEKLDQAVSAAFAALGEVPNLLPLSRALRTLKEKVGPLGAPEGAAPPPAAAGAAAAPTAPAAAVPETFASAAQAAEAVLKIARYLFGQDNKDPRAYRLARAVHFGGLAAAPKDALLPGVPPQRRQFFEQLATSANWSELLTQAEGQFLVTPLWLDLQRYVATALGNLGPPCAAAQQAVVLEAVALYARLPELFALTFKDRAPFADGATKAWIDQVRGEFAGGASAAGGRGREQDAIAAALAEARKLLSESKAPDAIARVANAIESCTGERQRFRARLALARLLMDMNRLTVATPLLEQLERQVGELGLDMWEPELAAEVFENLYDCFRRSKPKPTPEETQRGLEIFGRLCRVNPGAALKLDGAAAKT